MFQVRRGKRDNLRIIFHISPLKCLLRPIIRTASRRRFYWRITTCFHWEIRKIIFQLSSISPLTWSSDLICVLVPDFAYLFLHLKCMGNSVIFIKGDYLFAPLYSLANLKWLLITLLHQSGQHLYSFGCFECNRVKGKKTLMEQILSSINMEELLPWKFWHAIHGTK